MRLMCASSAEGAGTCDVDGCDGWVEREELVYICTAHNKYACRECVPRAARLTVDALLDECVMVEQEIEQFSQELGLGMVDVPTAARGEDDLCADKGVPTVVRQGCVREPVGMLPVIAEEVGGDGVADGDELNMGDTTGPEWDVGSMLVMQRGLVAASWVAGRRRVTREGTEREGRECRRKGDGGIEVEIETAVMDVDTSEDSSLRSLIGDEAGVIGSQDEDEAVVDDLAPQAPSHAGGEVTHRNICDMTAVKRKRQFEEGKNDQEKAKDVREKEKGQPQLSVYRIGEIEYADNSGSKRRRVHEGKGDCIEKTKRKAGENTMMERLEGDEAIE
jgi:hypothetical protein